MRSTFRPGSGACEEGQLPERDHNESSKALITLATCNSLLVMIDSVKRLIVNRTELEGSGRTRVRRLAIT